MKSIKITDLKIKKRNCDRDARAAVWPISSECRSQFCAAGVKTMDPYYEGVSPADSNAVPKFQASFVLLT